MAKEPSWRAKAMYIVFALALVFGLSAAIVPSQATPVGASPGTLVLVPGFWELQTSGAGTASWSTAQYHEGECSAELEIPTTYVLADAGRVAAPYTGDLNSITSLSYYYYVGATTPLTLNVYDGFIKGNAIVEPVGGLYTDAYGGPYLVIELDLDGNLAADTWVIQAQWASMTNVSWIQDTIDPTVSPFHVFSLLGASPFPLGTDWGSLNEVKAASVGPYVLGTATVLKVKIAVGEWNPAGPTPPDGPVVAYIDSLEINGATADVEPVLLDLTPHLAKDVKGSEQCFTAVTNLKDPTTVGYHWTLIPGLSITVEVPVITAGGGQTDDFMCIRKLHQGDAHVTVQLKVEDTEWKLIGEELSAEKKWGILQHTLLDVVHDPADPTTWAWDPVTETAVPGGLQHEVWVTRDPGDKIQEVVADWVFADFLMVAEPGHFKDRPAHAVVHWWLLEDKDENQAIMQALIDDLGRIDDWSGTGGYAGWPLTPFERIVALGNSDTDGDTDLEWADYTQWKDPAEGVPNPQPTPTLVGRYIQTETQDDLLGEIRGLALAELQNYGVDPATLEENVLIVVLVEYPWDYGGENPVSVEIGKKHFWEKPPVVPTQVKIPQVRWAGEKIVLEKNWGEPFACQTVSFQLEHPGLGTLEPVGLMETPWGMTGGGITFGEIVYTEVGADGVARVILDSEDPGQADVKCVLYDMSWEVYYPIPHYIPSNLVIGEHGFVVWFLKLEEVAVSVEEFEEHGELYAELDVQVKGWFTSADLSTRPARPVDLDGDAVDDQVLPAGRWVLPDDWPILAGADWKTQRPWWDIMDEPGDGVVATASPLGPYDGGVNSLSGNADFPVIGPFSTLQPIVFDPVTGLPIWDATASVPADGSPYALRDTVVPNFKLNWWDAPMPPAEVTFNIRTGTGSLDEKIKADLESPGPWDLPFYAVEIPAHSAIPPLSYPSGYSWDSWNWGTTDPVGPYSFWTDLHLPPFPDDDQTIEVYSDNNGFAAVRVTGPGTPVTITATADYPYLGKHPAMMSDEVYVWGEKPQEFVTWDLPAGINVDPQAYNNPHYDGEEVSLPTGTEPDELLAVYIYDALTMELLYYIPSWPSTLTTLEYCNSYIVIVSDACEWGIPQE